VRFFESKEYAQDGASQSLILAMYHQLDKCLVERYKLPLEQRIYTPKMLNRKYWNKSFWWFETKPDGINPPTIPPIPDSVLCIFISPTNIITTRLKVSNPATTYEGILSYRGTAYKPMYEIILLPVWTEGKVYYNDCEYSIYGKQPFVFNRE
jgi:hypothetical protein